MQSVQQKLDVERAVNLLDAFGWVKIEEKLDDGKVKVTFEKVVLPVEPPQ